MESCTHAPLARDTTRSVQVDGQGRSFLIHLPPTYDGTKATPVVLHFPAYTALPVLEAGYTDMNTTADRAGFVVVYPSGRVEGTQETPYFNAGACCGDATRPRDDIAFVRAMLADLGKNLCVDADRIYATGFSNGGMMSYRLACELSDQIAAFAPVSGASLLEPCMPKRPPPLLVFHGTGDPSVPWGGGLANPIVAKLPQPVSVPAVPQTIESWRARNRCSPARRTTYARGDVRCEAATACAGDGVVELCTIEGGGHTWPGAPSLGPLDLATTVLFGKETHDISANDHMWDFFHAHPLH
jgi:polyhydroxybutyrate depolymerase